MTDVARVEVTQRPHSTDPPRDWTDNTLWFQTEGAFTVTTAQALADMISGVYKLNNIPPTWGMFQGRGHTVKVFNMSDAPPRPIIATTNYEPVIHDDGDLAPRQIALCLSYYAGRNIPRQRGRIYIGPFSPTYVAKERPATTTIGSVLDLGVKLHNGGLALTPQWNHGVYASHQTVFQTVTDYWVNDVFDTQRRRVTKEVTRQRAHP